MNAQVNFVMYDEAGGAYYHDMEQGVLDMGYTSLYS